MLEKKKFNLNSDEGFFKVVAMKQYHVILELWFNYMEHQPLERLLVQKGQTH